MLLFSPFKIVPPNRRHQVPKVKWEHTPFSFAVFKSVQRKTVLEGILVGISISLFQ